LWRARAEEVPFQKQADEFGGIIDLPMSMFDRACANMSADRRY
jgi:hypothetical protein